MSAPQNVPEGQVPAWGWGWYLLTPPVAYQPAFPLPPRGGQQEHVLRSLSFLLIDRTAERRSKGVLEDLRELGWVR